LCEQERIDYALAFVGGVMMAVALLELLPEAQVQKKKNRSCTHTHTHTHTHTACMHARATAEAVLACVGLPWL